MAARYFFTSDTHFYHGNIIRFCNRPFEDVEMMNETIISNWNNTVGLDDTAIKFIIHFFSIYVHRCTLIICLSITHQTEMTEKHRKITVTNGYKNKIVGKFGKDSPTIQFIFSIRGRINYTMLCSSLESIYNTRFNAKDMNTQYRFRAFVTPNCDLR